MSPRCLFLSLGVVVVAGGLIFAQSPKRPAQRLTPQELQTIDRIARAYHQSETRAVLEMLSRLMGRMNEAKLNQLDQELGRRQLPESGRLLAELRFAYVQQGFFKQLPKPGPRETMAVLRAFRDRVERILEESGKQPALSHPLVLPSDAEAWDTLLWKTHVLANQLETARLMTDQMAQMAKGYPAGGVSRLSDADRELVQADSARLSADVRRVAGEVAERDLELRVARLKIALERWQHAASLADRLHAAYTAAVDARAIIWQAERAGQAGAVTATDEGGGSIALQSAVALAERAQQYDPDFARRAALLFEGLHWWLRGRYGMGPDVGGLAKSTEAMHSAAAQFGLYMPTETPRPSNPLGKHFTESVPKFERRHHYWWAWEDRRVRRGTLSTSKLSVPEEVFNVTLRKFW